MKNPKQTPQLIGTGSMLTILNFMLVSVMLACFAFVLGKFIQTLYNDWQGFGFSLLASVVAFESIIMRYYRQTSSRVFSNPFLSTISEITLILLSIKLYTMVWMGFTNIWHEIISWQRNFFQNFFDPDYLLLAFSLLFVWLLAGLFSQPLVQLEEDEELMEQEKLGNTFHDRGRARQQLISLVFILGGGMIAMLVVMKSNLEVLPFNPSPDRNFILVLMLYFISGFVLIALNQYLIMKARWYFTDITVNPSLAQRWLFYTGLFILLIVGLVIFLPTNFALGFFPIARFFSEILIYLFGILQFLIFIPIAFILSVINALFKGGSVGQSFQQAMPEFTPQEPEVTTTYPWWDIVKSILFWIIFLGMIFFSIRYYFAHRHDLKSFFASLKASAWFSDVWQWIKNGFRKVGDLTTQTIGEGYQRIKSFITEWRIKRPSFADLAKLLPPRQAVIFTYVDWVHWNRKHGLNRRVSQTPKEYADTVRKLIPEATSGIDSFTQLFVRARYTKEVLEKSDATQAHYLLSILKNTLREKLEARAPVDDT